ncbi:MAG: UbiD family decarboxylase [Candidatus Loosdrechtia sp.]|uniref:UbiD family decarboxylase n=1 Tax=Candidatus Loosdrechtia sp. TaxID=3101272 RepID=UPI003A7A00BF|nr:MAG: UbiD family decarboxylase [Candidatus Jettenia sp. AMX2]
MHKSMLECINDLERAGYLLRIREEVDPFLEMAAIHRQVHREKGPVVYYENIKGSRFPAVSNIFGTMERMEFLFRKSLKPLQLLLDAWSNPLPLLRQPGKWLTLSGTAFHSLPRYIRSGLPLATRLSEVRAGMNPRWKKKIPVLECECCIQDLPQVHSWPLDGGGFITFPQVCSLPPAEKPNILQSNLGMYRVQMSGNEYVPGREVGLHYQIHRGIGIHHTQAIESGKDLKVSIFVGGPPAHTVAAMMPLPEGMSELTFAGMLAARSFRYTLIDGWVISADADFCILGTVGSDTKPEGPFGDHLGYHSLKHPYPYLKVEKVFHRKDAVWPFTVVGRPPQEDSMFGKFVHRLTGNLLPAQVKGVREVHAVDAAGVHSLLLAIGSERYVPYARREPREILTQANALLGFNQISLTKYLFICASEDNPELVTSDVSLYLQHILQRVDWQENLYFQTNTTMDTLDYTGHDLHKGSKLVIAVAGESRRVLCSKIPEGFILPDGYCKPRLILPGIVVVEAPSYTLREGGLRYGLREDRSAEVEEFCTVMDRLNPGLFTQKGLAWIILVDDSDFCAKELNNFLWVCFLRSNPSEDTYGIQAFYKAKHWGCRESLVTDARRKPHHTTPMEEDPEVERKAAEKWKTTS